MMGRDILRADALRHVARDAFGVAPRIDEHEGGAMLADQLGQAVIDRRPRFARHHGFERRWRQFQGQIAIPHVTTVDDGAFAQSGLRADHEARDLFDRSLRRGQPHAHELVGTQRAQALQRQRQVRTAFVVRHRVNLIQDDGAAGREHRASRGRSQKHVERLGRRHHDMRRRTAHTRPFGLARIARPHYRANVHIG